MSISSFPNTIYFFKFIYFERERGREKIPGRLCTGSAESNVGLKLTNHEIMSWAKVGHLTNWAIQLKRLLLALLSNVNWWYTHGFISGLSILFYWSTCLFLCHTILFWLFYLYSKVCNQEFDVSIRFFLLKITVAFGVFVVPSKFRIVCSISVKNPIGILIRIALTL